MIERRGGGVKCREALKRVKRRTIQWQIECCPPPPSIFVCAQALGVVAMRSAFSTHAEWVF